MTKAKVNKKVRWALIAIIVIWFLALLTVYLHNANFAVLQPRGIIGVKQKQLLVLTFFLAMVVLIPVYIMTALIAWRYREGNKKAKYSPELSGNWLAETVWWGIPATIIFVLSIITWHTSHSLDPAKALASAVKPLPVQVVALDWKWLFIYPEQGVASVNELELPVGRPVQFAITADAPMNSFWIPQLAGQIYAMPGMATHLNLRADKAGTYAGSSANISGRGFAGMTFNANAVTSSQFSNWVQLAKDSPQVLNLAAYNKLTKPSTNQPVAYYSVVDTGLFNTVVNKYMTPGASNVR